MSVVRNWSGSGKIAIVSEPFHFKEIYNMFWKAKDMTFQGMLLDFPLFNIMARTMFFCEWCLELKWVRKSRDCERTLQLPGDLQYVLEVWRQDLSGDGFGFYISSILQPGRRFLWPSWKFTFLQEQDLKVEEIFNETIEVLEELHKNTEPQRII